MAQVIWAFNALAEIMQVNHQVRVLDAELWVPLR